MRQPFAIAVLSVDAVDLKHFECMTHLGHARKRLNATRTYLSSSIWIVQTVQQSQNPVASECSA